MRARIFSRPWPDGLLKERPSKDRLLDGFHRRVVRFPRRSSGPLAEEDERQDARIVHNRQAALQAPEVEIVIQGLDDERAVDVGRDELIIDLFPGRFPLEQRLARQHLMNHRQLAGVAYRTFTQSPTVANPAAIGLRI